MPAGTVPVFPGACPSETGRTPRSAEDLAAAVRDSIAYRESTLNMLTQIRMELIVSVNLFTVFSGARPAPNPAGNESP